MFACKVNKPCFHTRISLNDGLLYCRLLYYHGRVNTVEKRGSILEKMINEKDKRKHWHLNLQPTKPKVRIFDQVHKPFRRRAVLNSLFISNISDVISTGDAVPEILDYGLEITGVQVSPCSKIVNVFWQVPASRYDSCKELEKLLTIAAPKIRAELISRNVLGRVPRIYFLRDATNAMVSAYDEAMRKLELEPKSESGVIVDEAFVKNIYSFKNVKVTTEESIKPIEKEETKEEMTGVPHKPLDMKCDVFGLDRELLMDKVLALKKKGKNPPKNTAVILPESLKDADDLFCKIPGVRFHVDSSNDIKSRNAILKQFQIERKMLREKKDETVNADNHHEYYETEDTEVADNDDDNEFTKFYDCDFIEDETSDDPRS